MAKTPTATPKLDQMRQWREMRVMGTLPKWDKQERLSIARGVLQKAEQKKL